MKRTQLAAAVLLATGSVSAAAATYSVTPLPVNEEAKNVFATGIDNNGFMLATTRFEYNPPIDVEQLEDTGLYGNARFPLESEDDVKAGIFSDTDYTIVVNYLLSIRGSTVGQELAEFRSFVTDTTEFNLVPGFDEVTEKFDDYTQSVDTLARDSLAGDYIVGTSEGITKELVYTNEDGNDINYTFTELDDQAFVQVNGTTKRLPPVNDLLGGKSHAFAINQNLQVAGYGSVSFPASVQSSIETCDDEETRGDRPLELCYFAVRSGSGFSSAVNLPHIWQLDANGDVISTETFPLLFEPEEDDENGYYARAYDINNQGVAVGTALTGEGIAITRPGSQRAQLELEKVAVAYDDGATTELLPRDENLQSEAVAINDNGWVTGFVLRAPNSIARQRLFVYNLDTGDAKYPQGFFKSAGVDAKAINNNNIVVGSADVESSTDALRETHAFMYNIDTEEFTNLNELIGCDSPYTLVDAVDINDNNEIVVNARIKVNDTYITGNDIINNDGETVERDRIVALKLSPQANGTIENCDEDEESYERQGASISPLWAMLVTGLAVFRRRRS
ncbi:DUF3466 family protein [Alteromonas sp. ASW11-19]|uniref:DUF3466 family protein n=1 Tax=Alteromonas salexigens TaxID=2982530 RepID=A0ABT2VQH0_9ALTE|nr:DUF3466 family protein [Alteromonas salexigens]MCU7554159.1 DUF3466 family protein [Alteromonas salexigens]